MINHQYEPEPEPEPERGLAGACARCGAADPSTPPAWARRATAARADAWAADRMADPGDRHDRGERSLCVGEAR